MIHYIVKVRTDSPLSEFSPAHLNPGSAGYSGKILCVVAHISIISLAHNDPCLAEYP